MLDPDSLAAALAATVDRFGAVDGLINAAGGNRPGATTGPTAPFFDVPAEALRWVLDLNLLGTILPSQVVGRIWPEAAGVILNFTRWPPLAP